MHSQGIPVDYIEELTIELDVTCDRRDDIGLTSASAFLTIGVGASGFPPGVKAIPRCARTAFFGGGRR